MPMYIARRTNSTACNNVRKQYTRTSVIFSECFLWYHHLVFHVSICNIYSSTNQPWSAIISRHTDNDMHLCGTEQRAVKGKTVLGRENAIDIRKRTLKPNRKTDFFVFTSPHRSICFFFFLNLARTHIGGLAKYHVITQHYKYTISRSIKQRM